MCNFVKLATLLLATVVTVLGTKKSDITSIGLKDGKVPTANEEANMISEKKIDTIINDFVHNKVNEETGKAIKHPFHKIQLGALDHVAPGYKDRDWLRRKDHELPRIVPDPPKPQAKKFGLHTRNSINDNRFDRKNMKRPKDH
uniref:Uncharacterized protein n=1 Tax=Cuerna arida TaxID=1464854 RepID=A0A1B6FBM0_9HEMI